MCFGVKLLDVCGYCFHWLSWLFWGRVRALAHSRSFSLPPRSVTACSLTASSLPARLENLTKPYTKTARSLTPKTILNPSSLALSGAQPARAAPSQRAQHQASARCSIMLAHSRSFSLILANSRTFSHMLAHSRSFSFILVHSRSFSLSLSHSRSFSIMLAHSRSFSLILVPSRSLSFILVHSW